MKKRQKTIRRRKRRVIVFTAELAVLALVVAAAIYAPQVIFQVQDTILCGATSTGERENMDVEALSTTYERSLSKRMLNFAQGLAEGSDFYVASQELPIDEESYEELETLFSSQEIFWYLLDTLIISYEFYEQKIPGVITRHMQYVIYSDDYAKGVNFILRYMEIRDSRERVYKLLFDAETDTLYAFKAEYPAGYEEKPEKKTLSDEFWHEDVLKNMWYYFAVKYEAGFSEEQENLLWKLNEDLGVDVWDFFIMTEASSNEEVDEDSISKNVSGGGYKWENMEWSIGNSIAGYYLEKAVSMPKENEFYFRLPYGEDTSLDMALLIAEKYVHYHEGLQKLVFYAYPDFTLGIRQIYLLIPEFA